MSQIIYQILDYELSPVPAAIAKIFGIQISNGLCNGAFWLFILWSCFHILFDAFIYDIYRRRMEYKPFVGARLTNSLWLLVVYVFLFSYSLSLVVKYRLDLFNWRSKFFHANVSPPADISLGILLLSTFYCHMALYQRVRLNTSESAVKYLSLSIIYSLTYTNRKIEIPLILSIFIGASEFFIEITRILFCFPKDSSSWRRKLKTGIFIFSLLLWILTYIVIIPLRLVLSPIKRIWYDFRILQALLILFLVIWFVINLYESVLLKWFSHWLEHTKDEKYSILSDEALQFALFNTRRDCAFYWKTLRTEMKTREDEMLARRKPNNRNVLFHTIKCMLAIKRKRTQKKDYDDEAIENEHVEDTMIVQELGNNESTTSDSNQCVVTKDVGEDYQEERLVIKQQKVDETADLDNTIADETIEKHPVYCNEK